MSVGIWGGYWAGLVTCLKYWFFFFPRMEPQNTVVQRLINNSICMVSSLITGKLLWWVNSEFCLGFGIRASTPSPTCSWGKDWGFKRASIHMWICPKISGGFGTWMQPKRTRFLSSVLPEPRESIPKNTERKTQNARFWKILKTSWSNVV